MHHQPHPEPDMGRTLCTRDRRRVETRLKSWAAQHKMVGMPNPNLSEVRWNDDYSQLYINKESGLPAFFDSLFHEHLPIREGQHHAVYDAKNPAASVILEAIKEVTHNHLEA